MIRPTSQQLENVSPIERFWFATADVLLRTARPILILWNRLFMVHFSWLMTGPRVRRWGMEHLAELGPEDCLIFVSNHRSFFDFYVIGPILYTRTRLAKTILFPVRAPFFYDTVVGGVVNGIMSGFFMFPPIMREKEKRAFNAYALDRMVAELERPGMLLGIHPEGTRNKSPDPYTLLRAQPGVGTILARSAHTRVVPVFVTGLSNGFGSEFSRTWGRRRREFPIDVVFGAPIEFDDLREQGNRLAVHMKMTQRCMSAVEALGHHHRDEIAQTVGR